MQSDGFHDAHARKTGIPINWEKRLIILSKQLTWSKQADDFGMYGYGGDRQLM
jgi:hypothetical protein